jgi:hypothetical protein
MVVRNLCRPDPENTWNGRKKHTTRINRYMFGRISQARTACGLALVTAQNRRRDRKRGRLRRVASR